MTQQAGSLPAQADLPGYTATMTIGGRQVPGSAGATAIVNPSTEQAVGLMPEASAEDVTAAVEAAAAASGQWAARPAAERQALLAAFADLIEARRGELTPLIGAEMGGTGLGMANTQLNIAVRTFRAAAAFDLDSLNESFPPRPASEGGELSGVATRKPLGVVAVITAYNAPYVNFSTMGGPALAAGNTIVVKPAPQDPLGMLAVAALAAEAGFPPGVINMVSGTSPDIGRALVAHPQVNGIGFTGSAPVGVQIAQAAAAQLKPLLLELGGKGACVVLEDADLEAAVRTLSLTWMFHSGQICGAPTRAIVHESVHDELVRRLADFAAGLKIGPSEDPDTVLGPLISAAQRDKVEDFISSAATEGATIAVGGVRPDRSPGFYVGPTLLTDCRPDMRVVREEVFGPVLSMLRFSDEDEAVALANDTQYGLVNYVFSADLDRARRVASQLVSGVVNVNTFQGGGLGIDEMPFGGRRLSGIGRKGGKYAYEAFTEPVGITVRV